MPRTPSVRLRQNDTGADFHIVIIQFWCLLIEMHSLHYVEMHDWLLPYIVAVFGKNDM